MQQRGIRELPRIPFHCIRATLAQQTGCGPTTSTAKEKTKSKKSAAIELTIVIPAQAGNQLFL
jgi:hypothetical protein